MEESARTHRSDTHFVWEPPARDISILLNLELVERLEALLREPAEQELGGFLLGRCDRFQGTSERRIVVIEDFEAVDSEHLRGPAYSLSQQDSKRLERTLARARGNTGNVPVGFFRSHLRKGIYLDEADFSLFQAYFSSPCDVFLVARPRETDVPLAGFFYWQEDNLERRSSYLQFPLDRKRLETGGYQIGPRESPLSVSPEPRTVEVAHAEVARAEIEDVPSRRGLKRAIYGTLGGALVLTAVVCALMLRSGGDEVSLNVERAGPALKLSWDADAPAIAHANSALLVISDGGKQRRLQLNADELKVGSLVYTPNSTDVNFRLDLLKVAVQGTESVHYVADKQAPPVAAPVSSNSGAVAGTPSEAAGPAVQTAESRRPAARAKRVSDDDEEDDADRVDVTKRAVRSPASAGNRGSQAPQNASDAQPRTQEIAKSTAPSIPQQGPSSNSGPLPISPQPSTPPVQAAAVRPRADPVVNISTRALPPHRMQDWFTKVPLVRTFHGRGKENEFVPPRPVHQVTPHLPSRIARVLPGDWRVDLKLSVDREGRVKEVSLMSPGSDDRLVDISAEAVRQWRFEPARFHDKPVKCEVLTTLQFRNPMPDGSLAQR